MDNAGDTDSDYRRLIRAEHDRQRRYLIYVLTTVLMGAVILCSVMVLVIARDEILPFPIVLPWLALPVATVLAGWAIWRLRRALPTKASQWLDKNSHWAERQARIGTQAMLFNALLAVMMLVIGLPAAWHMMNGAGNWVEAIIASVILVIPAMTALMLSGHAGGITPRQLRFLNDEHTRSLRHRAQSFGFVFLLIETAGLCVIGLWNSGIAIILVPILLAVAVFAAVLRFALLERQAERDG